jgi:hypothetical protein
MRKSAYELMLLRTRQVVQAAGLLYDFEHAPHFSLCVENEGWMSLTIESWPASDPLHGEKRRVLVAHYAVSGGRRLPDPELEMTDVGFPIRLRQTVFGVMETPILWRDPKTGQVMINIRGKQNIAELLRIWAKNIKAQGFIEAASHIVSSGEVALIKIAECNERVVTDNSQC